MSRFGWIAKGIGAYAAAVAIVVTVRDARA
jgi:hypothetical protein